MLPEGQSVEVNLVLVQPAELTTDLFGLTSFPVAELGYLAVSTQVGPSAEEHVLIKSTSNGLIVEDILAEGSAVTWARDASYDEHATTGSSELYFLHQNGITALPVNTDYPNTCLLYTSPSPRD